MIKAHPVLGAVDKVTMAGPESLEGAAGDLRQDGDLAFGLAVADFYFTNPIARASAVMAECSALAAGRLAEAAE